MPTPVDLPTFKRTVITSNDQIPAMLELINHPDLWFQSVDTETAGDNKTDGLDPRRGKLRLIQISARDARQTFIIDCFKVTNLDGVRQWLLNPKIGKACQRGDFDSKFFMHNLDGAYIEHPIDTMLGALLLRRYMDGTSLDAFGLGTLMARYCGLDMSKELQVSDWSGELSNEQFEYAARDVEWLFPLVDILAGKIQTEGMLDTWAVENGCQMVTAGMEYYGIKVDTAALENVNRLIQERIQNTESAIGEYKEFLAPQQDIFSQADGKATIINLDSHNQVKDVLAKRWRMYSCKDKSHQHDDMCLTSTSAEELKKLLSKDPKLVDLLTERASMISMYRNHVQGLQSKIDPLTGRLHSNYFQLATPQHRYSSSSPPLLNIPRKVRLMRLIGCDLRSCFIAEPGNILVKADFGQLQLRAMAQESMDPLMLKAFKENLDLHSQTAALICDKPESEVGEGTVERFLGKTSNFAISFMCSPERLQETFLKDLGIYKSVAECTLFIKKYMTRYRGVAAYHKLRPAQCKREGRVRVPGGRATLFCEGWEPSTEAPNFTMALIEQSGVKKSMARLQRQFLRKEMKARIILNPHDEIVAECPESEGLDVAGMLSTEMIRSMSDYITKVPVVADSRIAKSWGG